MEIRYTYGAQRDLANLPRDVQKRIARKMRFYAAQDDPRVFAKRLADSTAGESVFVSEIGGCSSTWCAENSLCSKSLGGTKHTIFNF